MKNLHRICLVLTAILLLAPSSGWSLTPLPDEELSEIIGQTGVGITLDHAFFFHRIGQWSFRDPDGITSVADDAADLNLNGFELDLLRVEIILPQDMDIYEPYPEDYLHVAWEPDWDISYVSNVDTFKASPLMIDVLDELPVMSHAANYNTPSADPSAEGANVTGVFLGLPTVMVYIDTFELDSITMTSPNVNIVNEDASFGRLDMTEFEIDILGGNMEIAPHSASGIDIALDDVIVFGKIPELIYSDEDTSQTQIRIVDLKYDVLRINAITHLDATGQPQSPGDPVHLLNGDATEACNSHQADHYDFAGSGWKENFFSIDVTNRLPAMTAMESQGRPVAGVYMGLPAQEMYIDEFFYTIATGRSNDEETYGHFKYDGLSIVTLEGGLEIAPHGPEANPEQGYGVDIALDDVVMYISCDKYTYTDLDDGGQVVFNNFEMDMLRINSIALDGAGGLTSPGHGLHLDHLTAIPADFTPGPLTIDFSARLPKASEHAGGPVAGIAITLPTMEVYCDQIAIHDVALSHTSGTANNIGQPFFQNVRFTGASHAFLGGTVEISPH